MFFGGLRLKKQQMFRGKVFCIGFNKTGTTSLEQVLKQFGYRMGSQRKGELLLEDWSRREFRGILDLCRTADAFQDIPFSLPFTFQVLDQNFPGSKFILTVRDTPDEWYESMVRFHTKLLGKNRMPTAEDLQDFEYVYKGWLLNNKRFVYGTPDNDIYNRDAHIWQYQSHNANVTDYFRFKKDQLLVLNLKDPKSMEKLCRFLDIECRGQTMPHLNKSR